MPNPIVKGVHPNMKISVDIKGCSLYNFEPTNKNEILKIIFSLKNKTSVGWDEVPISLIKAVANKIAEPLSDIINKCFECGIFPEKLKYSHITPIYKKGARTDINNYRPISVLSNFSKIFEKVINFRLVNYFNSNDLFYEKQFGFRKTFSTNSALIEFINDVAGALDRSETTAGVFCDLSKAFDCVDHSILLSKLKDYGIKGKSFSLLDSYLQNRKYRTIVTKNGVKHMSNWNLSNYGVPQGSILGPLFFLIFINDLPKAIGRDLILFADDTTAIIREDSVNNLIVSIENTLDCMKNWFTDNGLKLNIDKTHIIKFSLKNNVILDKIPNLVESHRFLGVLLDTHINWKIHIDKMKGKLRSISFAFFHLINCVPQDTCITVYYGYVESILRYGIILWGVSTEVKSLLILQKKIIRILTKSRRRKSCKNLFKNLRIHTIFGLYINEILNWIHNTKENLSDVVKFTHNYNTRNKYNFRLPHHKLTTFRNSPQYMGLRLYNELPLYLKNLNATQFKDKIKEKIIEKAYYSLDEFLENPIM